MSAEMYEDDAGGAGRRGMVTRKRLSGKKIVIAVVALLVLVLGGGAALFFSGVLGGAEKQSGEEATKVEKPVQITYYDLPDMLVNLRVDGPRPSFLKISISLEIEHPEDRAVLERILPRVTDTFQVYLRELRVDQLQGSAGLLRLREELLSRVNAASRPVRVRDVLFKEMLVQ